MVSSAQSGILDMFIDPGLFKGNRIIYRRDKKGMNIDIYVGTLDELYIENNKSDFGISARQFRPALIMFILNRLKRERFLISRDVRVVFHLAEKHLENNAGPGLAADFKDAISTVRPYVREALKEKTVKSIRNFLLGFIFLVLALGVAEIILMDCERIGIVVGISQAISVFGWVVLWGSIEFILFEWGKVQRANRWVQRLSRAEINSVVWDGKTVVE